MLYKGFYCKIEDLDTKGAKGVIVAYVNAFGNKDLDGDISAPGSFDKTIKENFRKIKHFVDHNVWSNKDLVGVPLELVPDSVGLKVTSQLNLEKQTARDLYSDYKLFLELDRDLEHSIGYNVIKRDDNDQAVITEYRLHEYSTISFRAANPLSLALDAKSSGDPFTPADILDWIHYLEQALKKGDFTDKKFLQIETSLEGLNQTWKTLEKPGGDSLSLSEPLPDIDLVGSLDNIFKKLAS